MEPLLEQREGSAYLSSILGTQGSVVCLPEDSSTMAMPALFPHAIMGCPF